jgi:hypothetical protein
MSMINSNTFQHPVCKEVKFVSSGRFSHFTYNGKTIRGLYDLLEEVFWPEYSYDKAKLGWQKANDGGRDKQWKPNYSKADPATRGKRKGVKADQVMKQSLDLKRKYEFSAGLYVKHGNVSKRVKRTQCEKWMLEPGRQKEAPVGDQAVLMKLLNARIPDLRLLWGVYVKYGLRPVASQVCCGIAGLTATAVDDVALNAQDQLVPIERKKGGQNYLYKHTGDPLHYPFSDQTNCKLNQWLIEAAARYVLYCHSFPELAGRIGLPVLLRHCENPEVAEVFALPAWLVDRLHLLLQELEKHVRAKR